MFWIRRQGLKGWLPGQTLVEGEQRNSAVAMSDDGRFVAVWQGDAQDGSRFGIFGETGPSGTWPNSAANG
ncbi:MAG TPA: hypothetical protein VMW24_03060 [Sedimentisphaerales bacterium]|nr:hypothetical protein [Sedimentisphaerales bacterium]